MRLIQFSFSGQKRSILVWCGKPPDVEVEHDPIVKETPLVDIAVSTEPEV